MDILLGKAPEPEPEPLVGYRCGLCAGVSCAGRGRGGHVCRGGAGPARLWLCYPGRCLLSLPPHTMGGTHWLKIDGNEAGCVNSIGGTKPGHARLLALRLGGSFSQVDLM